MSSDQKSASRRSYVSPRRALQASQTREAVLAAATECFGQRGWAATGVRDIAKKAGVSVETVYANFGAKANLLMAIWDLAVAGDAIAVPLSGRAEFAALGDGQMTARAAAAADLLAHIHSRTVGIVIALRDAASAEPAIAARIRAAEERRRADVDRGAALIAGRPVTTQERDGLWALGSVEVYQMLTEFSGWSGHQYRAWLADMIIRLLEDRPS